MGKIADTSRSLAEKKSGAAGAATTAARRPRIGGRPPPWRHSGGRQNAVAKESTACPAPNSGTPASPYALPDSRLVQRHLRRERRRELFWEWYAHMSLKSAFAVYVTVFLLLALLLILLSVALLSGLRENIVSNYYFRATPGYDSVDVNGNELLFFYSRTGEIEYVIISGLDWAVNDILGVLTVLSVPALLVICVAAAGILFFRNRLAPPIAVLAAASEKISEKDLDFPVVCPREDELGDLCHSFDEMRGALLKNHNEMWRQMEERKRLNSAFSHDLRTPLTVLKGNAQILLEMTAERDLRGAELEATANAMNRHIGRLETYVEAMTQLQRLDDIEISRRPTDSREFSDTLKNISEILTDGKSLRFFDDIESDTLQIDADIVLQVAENLLANAARYAVSRVAVVCSDENRRLSISVSDDGPGFSKNDLRLALNPFYKAQKNVYDSHFGLGLNISKILSERHGGGITLGNVAAGGALVRAFFT